MTSFMSERDGRVWARSSRLSSQWSSRCIVWLSYIIALQSDMRGSQCKILYLGVVIFEVRFKRSFRQMQLYKLTVPSGQSLWTMRQRIGSSSIVRLEKLGGNFRCMCWDEVLWKQVSARCAVDSIYSLTYFVWMCMCVRDKYISNSDWRRCKAAQSVHIMNAFFDSRPMGKRDRNTLFISPFSWLWGQVLRF